MKLRIVSYNLNDSLRKPKKRYEILRLLQATGAHIFCLQEILRRRDLTWLLRHLGEFFICPVWHPGGMCIILDGRVCQAKRMRVWPLRTKEHGSYCNALVGVHVQVTAGTKFWVYSIHLDSRRYKRDETVRLTETDQLLRWTRYQPNVVMAGDWNSVSHADGTAKQSFPRSQGTFSGGASLFPSSETARCWWNTWRPPLLRTQRFPGGAKLFPSPLQPSTLLERYGFVDALIKTSEAGTAQRTWIPSKTDRIDRIHTRGMQTLDAGTVCPETLASVRRDVGVKSPYPGCVWPTGRDHCLIFADLNV